MSRITYRIAYQPAGKYPLGQSAGQLRFDHDYLTLRQALDRALVLNAGMAKVRFIQKVVGEAETERLNGAALATALDKRQRWSVSIG
jgi:UDP-N-acetyl-D-mannosaminuronic acid transferase (WecB/TagA/CpsF family)